MVVYTVLGVHSSGGICVYGRFRKLEDAQRVLFEDSYHRWIEEDEEELQ